MSTFRPYVDDKTFKYPMDGAKKSIGLGNSSFVEESNDAFEYFDLDEIVAGKSQLSAVGLSISRFYARMLVSQPFEVSRFLLQVGQWEHQGESKAAGSEYDDYDFEADTAESSDEEVDYFVDVRDMAGSGDQNAAAARRTKIKPSKVRDVKLFRPQKDSLFPEAVDIKGGPYIFSAMGALCDKEGVFSLWRGLNASCLCRAATGVLNAWITSFISSTLNIPDPQFVDLLQTSDPTRLLLVSTAGCAITAALLTPLFMIRARLISTSMTMPDRPRSLRWSLLDTLRRGQFLAPWWVTLPTALASTVNHAVLQTTPWLIWKFSGVDAFSSPRLLQFSQLGASLLALVVKMPLETLASRSQLKACHLSVRSLILRPVDYQGMLATLWDIVTGNASISSLYRGWRSEVVGVLGEWGYDALDEGKPAQQEKF